jgi:hypothetical protein
MKLIEGLRSRFEHFLENFRTEILVRLRYCLIGILCCDWFEQLCLGTTLMLSPKNGRVLWYKNKEGLSVESVWNCLIRRSENAWRWKIGDVEVIGKEWSWRASVEFILEDFWRKSRPNFITTWNTYCLSGFCKVIESKTIFWKNNINARTKGI